MGAFKKLKDILFDIEEEQVPTITKEEVIPTKEIIKEEDSIKEIKMPKKEILLDDFDRDKKESRFNFPMDFNEEFTRTKKNSRDYDFEEDNNKLENKIKLNSYLEPKRKDNKNFKPSPIISPVYGILDQNYTKDDVIVKSDIGIKLKDLDDVRKKAYGLNEKEDIKKEKKEEVKAEPKKEEETLKTLDEILIEKETITENIKVSYNEELNNEVIDKNETEETKTDEMLETDLFNLIDSMYEERKEREEEGQ